MSADDIDIADLLAQVTEAAANAASEVVEAGMARFHPDWMAEAFNAFHAITGMGSHAERRYQDLLKTQAKGFEQLADAHYRGLVVLGREIAAAIRNT